MCAAMVCLLESPIVTRSRHFMTPAGRAKQLRVQARPQRQHSVSTA